jgi:tryptophanyl-tRNA synthetase
MRQKYKAGGFGYGHAKQALYELIVDRFGEERAKYDQLMSNPSEIEDQLALGAEKARIVAQSVIGKVREKLGY